MIDWFCSKPHKAISSRVIQDMTKVHMDSKLGRRQVHQVLATANNQLLSLMTLPGGMEANMVNNNRVDMASRVVSLLPMTLSIIFNFFNA